MSQRKVACHCQDPSRAANVLLDVKQLFIVFQLYLLPDEVHWSPKQSMVPRSTSFVPVLKMIGLISRPGISCNYWDGISTVSMINGHLTLFVLDCHWLSALPVTEVFYFLYSASHTQKHIEYLFHHFNRKSFNNNRDNFPEQNALGEQNDLTSQLLVFPVKALCLVCCQKLSLPNFFLSGPSRTLPETNISFFFLPPFVTNH